MTKNLSARIAERATIKKPSRNGQNRAAFLALRGDVKQAIDDGWPVKLIWETLREEGKVSFGYQAFRVYANRLILSSPASKATVRPSVVEKKPDDSATTGFTFNRAPKKEDLL